MPRTGWTPSLAPKGDDPTVYLVVDDFGRNGRIFREATDLDTVVADLLDGQYKNPLRVVALNTAQGWSQDVSSEIAQELRRRCELQMRDVLSSIQDFVERAATVSSRCGWRKPVS
ncbi:hypothetical protein ACFIOY_28910 [Bradyrhizobium sp. TZ2]